MYDVALSQCDLAAILWQALLHGPAGYLGTAGWCIAISGWMLASLLVTMWLAGFCCKFFNQPACLSDSSVHCCALSPWLGQAKGFVVQVVSSGQLVSNFEESVLSWLPVV
jgi:hypothetical protein